MDPSKGVYATSLKYNCAKVCALVKTILILYIMCYVRVYFLFI